MDNAQNDFHNEMEQLKPLSLVRDHAAFFISLDGIIRSWNLGVELILGYQEDEFIGLPGATIFTPEDRLSGSQQREMELAANESWANDERWHVKKNGTRFWARGSLTAVKDVDGNLQGFVKVLRDATKARQRREELEAREERLRIIVETANEAIVMLSSRGSIEFCNRQFADIVGEPVETLPGRLFVDYIQEADKEVITRCFKNVNECGREQHEISLKGGDGSEPCWVLASVSPLNSSEGGLLCFLTDVTETRRATEEIRLSEARFRALVENSSGAITMMQPDGTLLYSSPAMGRSLGYEPEELKKLGNFQLLHPADRDAVIESFNRLASIPGHSITKEYRLQRADGSYAWCEGVATNLIDDPAVCAIVVNSRDITETKHAEQMAQEALSLLSQESISAQQASQQKNAYIGSMSHEIRTPLNAIIGYAELMMEQDGKEVPESFRRDLERIVMAGRHLLELVTGILDLSKIEAGKMDTVAEELDLSQLVQSTADTSQSLIKKNDNELEVRLPREPVILRSDSLKLRQVLLNLLSNAAKFTVRGTVRVTVQPVSVANQPWVRVIVEDTGVGMTRQQMGSLFEPYKSGANAVRQGGTGLGLVLTRRFCQLLGGELTAESTPGRGSTFTVNIPCDVNKSKK